jgi:integrase
MSLTIKKVVKLVRAGKAGMKLDGPPSGVRGLYLVIENKRNASWGLRYQINKRTRWMGLGSAALGDGVTLDQAREKAKAARQTLRDKIDPLEQRRAEQAARAAEALKQITFAEAGAAYIAAHEASWKNPRHREQWVQTLRQYARPINALLVDQIDTALVLKCIEPLWATRTETASRLRGRIESVLDWCKVRGYRPKDVGNPAKWGGNLEHLLPKRSAIAKPVHHPAMPYADVPAFVEKLRTRQGTAAQALLFMILTASRTSETLLARWSEVDLKSAVWTVPAERMKAGKEYKVPLSDAAVDLLRGLPREGDGFIFIGSQVGAPLNPKALHRVVARMKVNAVPHGFRASFSTWAHEQTAHANHTIELSLAHTVGTDVERAYRRTDMFAKRRQLLVQWSRYCMSPPVKVSGDVLKMRERA